MIKDVPEEYLFNSDNDNDSDNETIGSVEPDENTTESVESSSDEDFGMTTDEADAHFLNWKKGFNVILDNHDEDLVKFASFE